MVWSKLKSNNLSHFWFWFKTKLKLELVNPKSNHYQMMQILTRSIDCLRFVKEKPLNHFNFSAFFDKIQMTNVKPVLWQDREMPNSISFDVIKLVLLINDKPWVPWSHTNSWHLWFRDATWGCSLSWQCKRRPRTNAHTFFYGQLEASTFLIIFYIVRFSFLKKYL